MTRMTRSKSLMDDGPSKRTRSSYTSSQSRPVPVYNYTIRRRNLRNIKKHNKQTKRSKSSTSYCIPNYKQQFSKIKTVNNDSDPDVSTADVSDSDSEDYENDVRFVRIPSVPSGSMVEVTPVTISESDELDELLIDGICEDGSITNPEAAVMALKILLTKTPNGAEPVQPESKMQETTISGKIDEEAGNWGSDKKSKIDCVSKDGSISNKVAEAVIQKIKTFGTKNGEKTGVGIENFEEPRDAELYNNEPVPSPRPGGTQTTQTNREDKEEGLKSDAMALHPPTPTETPAPNKVPQEGPKIPVCPITYENEVQIVVRRPSGETVPVPDYIPWVVKRLMAGHNIAKDRHHWPFQTNSQPRDDITTDEISTKIDPTRSSSSLRKRHMSTRVQAITNSYAKKMKQKIKNPKIQIKEEKAQEPESKIVVPKPMAGNEKRFDVSNSTSNCVSPTYSDFDDSDMEIGTWELNAQEPEEFDRSRCISPTYSNSDVSEFDTKAQGMKIEVKTEPESEDDLEDWEF